MAQALVVPRVRLNRDRVLQAAIGQKLGAKVVQ